MSLRARCGSLRKTAKSVTQQIASLTESIRSSIGETVTAPEQAKSESHENASRLLVVSDEAASSSAQSQQMHDRMHSMVALVDSQGSAVNGINRTVTGLFEMSENSSRQADGLHTLSGELNAAAKGLTTVVAFISSCIPQKTRTQGESYELHKAPIDLGN